jgi:hypothetical protein
MLTRAAMGTRVQATRAPAWWDDDAVCERAQE